MAEFDLKIEYIPSKENVAADVLSCDGKVVDAEHIDLSMLHSLVDPGVEQAVQVWLNVVAPHIEFASCVAVAL